MCTRTCACWLGARGFTAKVQSRDTELQLYGDRLRFHGSPGGFVAGYLRQYFT